MAKQEGKIVRLGKGFGFAKMDNDEDWFVHHTAYSGPMVEGDHIRAEREDGPKGPRAKDGTTELLSRGSPMAASAPRPTPSQPKAIEVEWSVSPPNKNVLPLTLTLTHDKQLLSGVEVTLKSNSVDVDSPTLTPSTAKGKVSFLVPLDTQKVYALAASYEEDGKTKVATHIWEKRKRKKAVASPVAATPATDAELKLPEIEVVNPPRDPDRTTDKFLVNVVTRKDGKKADRIFTAHGNCTLAIEQSFPAGMITVSTFTSDTPGHYTLYIDFDGIMAKVIFQLDNGKKAEVSLRK